MRRTVGLLILGLVALGTLAATSVHDLISARTTAINSSTSGTAVRIPVQVEAGPYQAATYILGPEAGSQVRSTTIPAARWWHSTPTLAVAIVALALVIAAFIVATRHGVYAPHTLRLLGGAGLVTLVGGPIAALVGYLSSRWAPGDTGGMMLWMPALLCAVIGGALLAIRGLLHRAGAMRAELDGVI